jgi:hypothetical protein
VVSLLSQKSPSLATLNMTAEAAFILNINKKLHKRSSEMVEIFKTNVRKRGQANLLIEQIERAFPGYSASFDLEDCDQVLRIHAHQQIRAARLIALLNQFGFQAEILQDELPFPFPAFLLSKSEATLT